MDIDNDKQASRLEGEAIMVKLEEGNRMWSLWKRIKQLQGIPFP